jgi:hypothetical protein
MIFLHGNTQQYSFLCLSTIWHEAEQRTDENFDVKNRAKYFFLLCGVDIIYGELKIPSTSVIRRDIKKSLIDGVN